MSRARWFVVAALAGAWFAIFLLLSAWRHARQLSAEPAPQTGDSGAVPTSLADEQAMIEQAQAALARGDTAQALATLHEHERRFPSGKLITQRKLLQAYATRQAEPR